MLKTIVIQNYKNADTYTIKADHGLGLIIRRPNKNILKIEKDNFKDLKFADYFSKHAEFMNPVNVNQLDDIIKN